MQTLLKIGFYPKNNLIFPKTGNFLPAIHKKTGNFPKNNLKKSLFQKKYDFQSTDKKENIYLCTRRA